MNAKMVWSLGVSALMAVAGCATEDVSAQAPEVDGDTLGEEAMVSSQNAAGWWYATAHEPWSPEFNTVVGRASFDGPQGVTRRMGVCLLQMTNTPCTGIPVGSETKQQAINRECAASPSHVPTGGFRYCAKADGESQKRCAVRPGSPANFCAGTPALGGAQVYVGYKSTPVRGMSLNVQYVSDACFEGCTATDPSVSSAVKMDCEVPVPEGVEAEYCADARCDGTGADYCVRYGQPFLPMY